MGKRVGGIILLVLGVMALFGGIVNGSLARTFSGVGNPISNATTLILMAATAAPNESFTLTMA